MSAKDYSKIEEELVIICHCPPVHAPVYFLKEGRLDKAVSPIVPYVDPNKCPLNTWAAIAENSKTYVWGINCPVAGAISRPDHMYAGHVSAATLRDILNEAGRILKDGGQVLFPGPYNPSDVAKIQANVGAGITHKWAVSIIPSDSYLFLLGFRHATTGVLTKFSSLAIFTKIAVGGRRTRRRRRSNRRTRSHPRPSGRVPVR